MMELYVGPLAFCVSWPRHGEMQFLMHPDLILYKSIPPFVLKTIRIELRPGEIFSLNKKNKSKEWKKNWRISPDHSIVQFWCDDMNDFSLELEIISDSHFCIRSQEQHPRSNALPFLITSALRWICVHESIRSGGFLLHSTGLLHKSGTVLVGSGPSGAGKSTLANYFANRENFSVLSDETILLLQYKDEYWAFGSPWPGMLGAADNRGGPLNSIVFLEKDTLHSLSPCRRNEAFMKIFQEIFLPPYDSSLTFSAIRNIENLLEHKPAAHLGFAKSESVVEFLQDTLWKNPGSPNTKNLS